MFDWRDFGRSRTPGFDFVLGFIAGFVVLFFALNSEHGVVIVVTTVAVGAVGIAAASTRFRRPWFAVGLLGPIAWLVGLNALPLPEHT